MSDTADDETLSEIVMPNQPTSCHRAHLETGFAIDTDIRHTNRAVQANTRFVGQIHPDVERMIALLPQQADQRTVESPADARAMEIAVEITRLAPRTRDRRHAN